MTPAVRFRAMGGVVHVRLTSGGEVLLRRARQLVAELEGKWSRFDDGSELQAINRHDTDLCVVSRQTYGLIELAVEGWAATGGHFDPTVGHAISAAGYESSWYHGAQWRSSATSPAPGCDGIELVSEICGVRLPKGVRLDLGGVAKGHAADLVLGMLLRHGASGALVSIGGDVAVGGTPPRPRGWVIELPALAAQEAPEDPEPRGVPTLELLDGGVCTSSVRRRRWTTRNGDAHHLIHPASGAPVEGDVTDVVVTARRAGAAEIAATAALAANEGAQRLLNRLQLPAATVTRGGGIDLTPAMRRAVSTVGGPAA